MRSFFSLLFLPYFAYSQPLTVFGGNCEADILFVLDVSGSIQTNQFEDFKGMMRAVSENIDIDSGRHQVRLCCRIARRKALGTEFCCCLHVNVYLQLNRELKNYPLSTSRLPVRYAFSVREGLTAARIACQSPSVK